MYVPKSVWAGVRGNPKRASDPQELKSQEAISCLVWVLGTRGLSTSKHCWPISPVHGFSNLRFVWEFHTWVLYLILPSFPLPTLPCPPWVSLKFNHQLLLLYTYITYYKHQHYTYIHTYLHTYTFYWVHLVFFLGIEWSRRHLDPEGNWFSLFQ